MEKKHYFVTIDTQEIREISIPDSGVEYEITANHKEIEELQELFMKKNKDATNATEYIGKPFDEWGADEERGAYNDHMLQIHKKIFQLGTEETKAKISELGII
ncbi:hypothetical protein [Lentibacillus sediminis]|uniref:hypothetical protein n=1 Tax=Lentibacillus sediminis TaxID=1940529 RepID=UPI000C1B831B|nr:hypothetical protein [Lentibacillus sediminis]